MTFTRLHHRWLPLLFAAALAGCTASADHPALKDATLPPLIQAHHFAYQRDVHGGYQLSPDGRKLAWTGPSWVRKALYVRHNATGEVRRYPVFTGAFHWTNDSRRLLSTGTDKTGAENTHVYMLDTDDPAAQIVDLTPYPGVRATIQPSPGGDPSQLLVYHNRRDKKLFDLYRIDLNTGKETLVAANPGDAVAPLTTREGGFKGWQRSREALRSPEERRTPRAVRPAESLKSAGDVFTVLGVSRDGSMLWALSNRGRDRVALIALHRKLGWEKVLHEDPYVDVTRVTMSRVTGEPLIAYTLPGLPQATIFDEKLRADLAPLTLAQGGEPYSLELVSADATEKNLVIAIHSARAQRYYLLDRAHATHTLLAENITHDAAQPLGQVKPVTIVSRDNLTLHAYLTLPPGVTARPLPLVLWVHGGPWLRNANPLQSEDAANAQFLANRGYAVLQVDFRGSMGYGKTLLNAGVGEFAGKMHDDLLDAVRWAVDNGIADKHRVAIMGWSYGGYAALVGMTMTPDTFACGISLAGPTDLATLIESFPPYWADLSMWHDYVGNPKIAQDREDMTRKSPLTHAASAKKPILIVHGVQDVRVRIDQSDRMVQALRQAGKPVEYERIADMGHGASWWVHRLKFLRKSEDFLQRCLGGRASRLDPFDPVAWVWHRVSR